MANSPTEATDNLVYQLCGDLAATFAETFATLRRCHRMQWDLPPELADRIVQAAAPHIRLRVEVSVQNLRVKAHVMRCMEQEIAKGVLPNCEDVRRLDTMAKEMTRERLQLLDMLCLLQRAGCEQLAAIPKKRTPQSSWLTTNSCHSPQFPVVISRCCTAAASLASMDSLVLRKYLDGFPGGLAAKPCWLAFSILCTYLGRSLSPSCLRLRVLLGFASTWTSSPVSDGMCWSVVHTYPLSSSPLTKALRVL